MESTGIWRSKVSGMNMEPADIELGNDHEQTDAIPKVDDSILM